MKHDSTIHYLHRDRRFGSVRREFAGNHTVDKDFADAKEIVTRDAVGFGYVHEGFAGAYLRLIDSIQMLFESLFEIFPDGYGRIDVDQEGINVRFITKRGVPNNTVHTMIRVGWEYTPGQSQDWEEKIRMFESDLTA